MKRIPRFTSALLWAMVFLPPAAALGAMPQPSDLPSGLTTQQLDEFTTRRSALIDRMNTLHQELADLSGQCGHVATDSPLVEDCRNRHDTLLSELNDYNNAVKQFDQDVAQTGSSLFMPSSGDQQTADSAAVQELISCWDSLTCVPKNLAKDPAAARLSQARLDQVTGQITRLQKAIDLLSYNDNPHWSQHWQDLISDMRETDSAKLELGLEMISAGLASENVVMRERHIKVAQKALNLPEWKEVAAKRVALEKLALILTGQERDGILKTATALRNLEKARQSLDTAEAFEHLTEACVKAKEGYELSRRASEDPKMRNVVWQSVLIVGNTGSLFAKESIRHNPYVVVVDTALKVGQAGVLISQSYQEDRRMQALSTQSYDRQKKKLELEPKLRELENLQQRLDWAAKHAI